MKYITLLLIFCIVLFSECSKKVPPVAHTAQPDTMYLPNIYRGLYIYYLDKDYKDSSLLGDRSWAKYRADSIDITYSQDGGASYKCYSCDYQSQGYNTNLRIAYLQPIIPDCGFENTIIMPDTSYFQKLRFNYKYVIHLNTGESDTVQVMKDKDGYEVKHYLNNQLERTTEIENAEDTQEFKIYR